MSQTTTTVAEIVAHAIGSEQIHSAGRMFPRVRFTDGVLLLAETFGAYWLVEAIASHICHNPKRRLLHLAATMNGGRITWTLKVRPNQRATLTAWRNAGERVLVRQVIEYTDFPVEGVEILAGWTPDVDADGYAIENSRGSWTLHLRRES